ncbi:MAG: ABC transporter substrate-binding protein [Streptosporangiales bacterium]|nr:ABC transporter substrate-binding protein [Streptosporangiales bacterium]
MKPIIRMAGAGTAVLTASALLAACGGGGTTEAGDSCSGQKITVGITSSSSDAPLYVAQRKGYFKKQGLTVTFQPFDSAAKMIAPLGSGQLDVGAGAPSAGFYNAVSRGLPLRIVADKGSMPKDYGYMPVMVRKALVDSGKVKTAADLKGLRVAEPAKATATSSTLAAYLQGGGLKYNDVQHEYIGFAQHVVAFQNGAIDASLTTEPSATVAEKAGVAVRIATPPDFYDKQQLAVLLYNGKFAERKNIGTCFMTAYLQGARDYMAAFDEGKLVEGAKGDEIVKVVTSATGLKPAIYSASVPNYVDPNGAVNIAGLKRDYAFFKQQGLLQGDVDVAKLVDPSFAKAAVAKLGDS